jgi:hypothetical protein
MSSKPPHCAGKPPTEFAAFAPAAALSAGAVTVVHSASAGCGCTWGPNFPAFTGETPKTGTCLVS